MSLRDNYIFDLDENVTRTPVSYKNQFGSRAEATNRNRWQTRRPQNPLSYLRSVADGCHQLRPMVRRGSTVRVRQRASLFSLLVPGRSPELSCYSPARAGVRRTCPIMRA